MAEWTVSISVGRGIVRMAKRVTVDDVAEAVSALIKYNDGNLVEVVRCRECDWGKGELICTNPKCGKSWYGCPVPPEHYCSYGERSEGE